MGASGLGEGRSLCVYPALRCLNLGEGGWGGTPCPYLAAPRGLGARSLHRSPCTHVSCSHTLTVCTLPRMHTHTGHAHARLHMAYVLVHTRALYAPACLLTCLPTAHVSGWTPAAGDLAGEFVTAAGPHSPSPSPSLLVPQVHLGETEGMPQLGGAVSVISNRPCRTSQEGTGRGKRGALRRAPCMHPPVPHLERTPLAEPDLDGAGRRAPCSAPFRGWGCFRKERLLVGCSDPSGLPASEAKQAGP